MTSSLWRPFNPNPRGLLVGDCTVRSICAVTGLDWHAAHNSLCGLSSVMADMPSADRVWHELLRWCGFHREELPDRCRLPRGIEALRTTRGADVDLARQCYTVQDFCRMHPHGIYVLGPPSHAVAVISGQYWDAWDSGLTVPEYILTREEGLIHGL